MATGDAAQAMQPLAEALRDYFRGDTSAETGIVRDDGVTVPLPARHFFRTEREWSEIEHSAVGACTGNVLDIGAGAGCHALVLQERGLQVTALDASPVLVELMRERGVRDARCGDIFEFADGAYDTMLLLGHGVGMVGSLDRLKDLLLHLRRLLNPNGCILAHSLDVQKTGDPINLAYHARNRAAGRYVGEVRMCVEYRGLSGPWYGWPHIDPYTLERHAQFAGFSMELIHQDDRGDYLACLSRRDRKRTEP